MREKTAARSPGRHPGAPGACRQRASVPGRRIPPRAGSGDGSPRAPAPPRVHEVNDPLTAARCCQRCPTRSATTYARWECSTPGGAACSGRLLSTWSAAVGRMRTAGGEPDPAGRDLTACVAMRPATHRHDVSPVTDAAIGKGMHTDTGPSHGCGAAPPGRNRGRGRKAEPLMKDVVSRRQEAVLGQPRARRSRGRAQRSRA